MDPTLPSRLGQAAAKEKAATAELRRVLAEAFATELTNSQIARYMRRSPDAVRVRRQRHNKRKLAGV